MFGDARFLLVRVVYRLAAGYVKVLIYFILVVLASASSLGWLLFEGGRFQILNLDHCLCRLQCPLWFHEGNSYRIKL